MNKSTSPARGHTGSFLVDAMAGLDIALWEHFPPTYHSKNWMTPHVHEQYGFWMPSARNTGLMIETYWNAYAATKRSVYLAKMKSIANNFTRVQQAHGGDYPTFFTSHPMPFWINNSLYSAKMMMDFPAKVAKLP